MTSAPIDPLHSDAPLIVYIDIKSPYAFVAYRPTLALEKELETAFDWRPLTLDIPSYLGSARKQSGKVVRSEGRSEVLWRRIRHAYADARRYAERQGLVLKGTEKIWDSRRINIAMHWVATQHRDRLSAFLEGVYPRFWRRELDIEDAAVVDTVLSGLGLVPANFETYLSGEGGSFHDALQTCFHERGIYGVPTYVVDGQPFFGREHIPYLRWALGGRRGPAPDIAYEIDKSPC